MATTTIVKPVVPVPSDIDIAQSVKPKHISLIAEASLGLQPEEYELYGTAKAKVGAARGRCRRACHLAAGAPLKAVCCLAATAVYVSKWMALLVLLPQVKLEVRDRLKNAPSGKYGEQQAPCSIPNKYLMACLHHELQRQAWLTSMHAILAACHQCLEGASCSRLDRAITPKGCLCNTHSSSSRSRSSGTATPCKQHPSRMCCSPAALGAWCPAFSREHGGAERKRVL
jgi:hypothetical protein